MIAWDQQHSCQVDEKELVDEVVIKLLISSWPLREVGKKHATVAPRLFSDEKFFRSHFYHIQLFTWQNHNLICILKSAFYRGLPYSLFCASSSLKKPRSRDMPNTFRVSPTFHTIYPISTNFIFSLLSKPLSDHLHRLSRLSYAEWLSVNILEPRKPLRTESRKQKDRTISDPWAPCNVTFDSGTKVHGGLFLNWTSSKLSWL